MSCRGVEDAADLAVHRSGRADDVAAECLADRLMAEADAEDRDFPRGGGDEVQADAGLVRSAWAGGEHDRFRLAREGVGYGELVVAHDLAPGANVAQEVEQVEGEAIVVVDQQDHGGASCAGSVGRSTWALGSWASGVSPRGVCVSRMSHCLDERDEVTAFLGGLWG